MIELIATDNSSLLESYESNLVFKSKIDQLRQKAAPIVQRLAGRTIWMISSTAQGGGVAEMLPSLTGLMQSLGFSIKWAVITSSNRDFFKVTKRIHNLIHSEVHSGLDFSADDLSLYKIVNRENADSLKPYLNSNDVLIVQDPQPLPLGAILHNELGLQILWRCHIGSEKQSAATNIAWDFLRSFLKPYELCAFTALDYSPPYLRDRARVICPGIDPQSHKNRDLSFYDITDILTRNGLGVSNSAAVQAAPNQVLQLMADGELTVPKKTELLTSPCIVQISRWDRLKGWKQLMAGFVRFKEKINEDAFQYSDEPDKLAYLRKVRLVMAAPDPFHVHDDSEGAKIFNEIRQEYLELPAELRNNIVVLLLPMASRMENALIVNALQRVALIIVQNSLQEGFGLTVTEAMWKGRPVMGSASYGVKLQIQNNINGVWINDPYDKEELSQKFCEVLLNSPKRQFLGANARYQVLGSNLIFSQIFQYLDLLDEAA